MQTTPLSYPINLQFFAGEKTEKATPKQRQEARKKGQVAKSHEISQAVTLLSCFLLLWIMGSSFGSSFTNILRGSLTRINQKDITINNVHSFLNQLTLESVFIVAPILLAVFLSGLIANFMQVGFLFTMEPLKMDLKKIDPLQGAKRLLSLRSIIELFKSILKVLLTSAIASMVLWKAKDDLIILSQKSIANVLSLVSSLTLNLGLFISLFLFVLAVLDYIYQRYEHEKSIRMSKQDIKDEAKKSEGDPLIKGKIRQRQREMAMRRMMQEIPKADVVITNPTHFAVAVRYDASEMKAPMVIAKGKDHVALKIKEIAAQENIITMENKPLARALFAEVEIGQEIPESLFKAVAEVLAYVYRLKRKV